MALKGFDREAMKELATTGNLGFMLVFSTFAGLGAGLLIDKATGLSPLFTVLLFLLGIAAGFINLVVKASMKK